MNPRNPVKIELGLEGFCERKVTPELTLTHVNPDWPAVFTTPAMIAMMEQAGSHAVRNALPPGSITVGVRIEVDHLKAVPCGVTVTAFAKLVKIDGRRLVFEVEARSGDDVIGRGLVFHTVVDQARFMASLAGRLSAR